MQHYRLQYPIQPQLLLQKGLGLLQVLYHISQLQQISWIPQSINSPICLCLGTYITPYIKLVPLIHCCPKHFSLVVFNLKRSINENKINYGKIHIQFTGFLTLLLSGKSKRFWFYTHSRKNQAWDAKCFEFSRHKEIPIKLRKVLTSKIDVGCFLVKWGIFPGVGSLLKGNLCFSKHCQDIYCNFHFSRWLLFQENLLYT